MFSTLKILALTEKIEGWVIYYQNKAWKIRMNMLVNSELCAYNDKEETSIKPFVY